MDIETREHIEFLLHHFYQKLLADPAIAYVFTDVAKINIETHMPILADFWEMILFQKDSYRKNLMELHLHLNEKEPLTATHFATWLRHFNETVDEYFTGEKAFLAKQRALSIATSMQIKITQP